MSDEKFYDVFLSHNTRDKPLIKKLATCLKDRAGLSVWLDEWNLIAGDAWQQEIERALANSKTCAVFIGAEGISLWHNEEMRAALQIRLKQPQFRVIPVLLPDASLPHDGESPLPTFLSGLTCVNFKGADDICEHEGFNKLVAGIRGQLGARNIQTHPQTIECPYRGLEEFDEVHEKFFFGRETLTADLIESLRAERFVAVLGASGCGKSSLVRAGLLPKLRAGALPLSDSWTYVIFRPGDHPLQELALSLTRLDHVDDQLTASQELLKNLISEESSLHGYVRLLLAKQRKDSRLLILIDQFEEMFSCKDRTERTQFVNNLRYAVTATGGQTIVVITMREDFLARAAGQASLTELLSTYKFIVGPMSVADFRRAIEEPARIVKLQFERGLVHRILNDIGQEPGALPLLEDTLLQLWESRTSKIITLEAYEESGGVQRSLAVRADATFNTLSATQQAIARRVLLRLTQPGEGAGDTRRRVPFSELITDPAERAGVEQVISCLSNARLLTSSGEEGKEAEVDVAHEALIRGWPLLRQWIEEERDTLRVQRRLTHDAEEWKKLQGGKRDGLLYRGLKLASTKEWRSNHEKSLSISEREFLDASLEYARKQKRVMLSGILLALVFIIGIGWFLYRSHRVDKSHELAAEARSLIEKGESETDYHRALSIAVEAVDSYETTEAKDVLKKALLRAYHVDLFHPQSVANAAFSPDGRYIVTVDKDKAVRLWDVVRDFSASPKLIPTARSEPFCPDAVKGICSKDGRLRLTITERNDAQMSDIRTDAVLHSNIGHKQRFTASFSADSRRVVTASDDRTAKVWDALTGQRLCVLEHDRKLDHAEFSPNGQYLLTMDGEAKIWDANTYRFIRRIGAAATFGTFVPDASSVVLFDSANAITFWDVDKGTQILTGKLRRAELAAKDFLGDISPDGSVVAEIDNGRAILKDVDGRVLLEIKEALYDVQVTSVEFSPDNSLILVVFNDKFSRSVRLYECDVCGSFRELLAKARERSGRL